MSSETSYIHCCNYDCWEKLDPNRLYNENGFQYCNDICASDHWYDIKKERRRAYYHAIQDLTQSVEDAHKYANDSIVESVKMHQEFKAKNDE
jgi:hypothetical protein